MVTVDPRPALWRQRRDEKDRLKRYQQQRLYHPCDDALDHALAHLIIDSLAAIRDLEDQIAVHWKATP